MADFLVRVVPVYSHNFRMQMFKAIEEKDSDRLRQVFASLQANPNATRPTGRRTALAMLAHAPYSTELIAKQPELYANLAVTLLEAKANADTVVAIDSSEQKSFTAVMHDKVQCLSVSYPKKLCLSVAAG